MIHAIYIISNEGEPLFIREYSKSDLKIVELNNFVSTVADFAGQFSEKNKNSGLFSFVLGQNGFVFHRNSEFTIIAVIDSQLDQSDISKIKKVYKKFQEMRPAMVKDGKSDKTELEKFEKEVFKIVEGKAETIINFQLIEDVFWKNPEK
ncbi:MAG: hypothetical protein QXO71_04635 [Candidatus Jordarchaeaceae archaeon]